MCMKNKAMIIFSLTALLMFSQYALPNSFADSNNATTYSVSDLNATSSASFIPPVIVQSSSDTSPDSSTVQTVVTQSVPAQPDTVQPIANQNQFQFNQFQFNQFQFNQFLHNHLLFSQLLINQFRFNQ